jgi:hypothetical protein
VLVSIKVRYGEERSGDIQIIGTERLLPDGQAALEERLGLGVAVPLLIG